MKGDFSRGELSGWRLDVYSPLEDVPRCVRSDVSALQTAIFACKDRVRSSRKPERLQNAQPECDRD